MRARAYYITVSPKVRSAHMRETKRSLGLETKFDVETAVSVATYSDIMHRIGSCYEKQLADLDRAKMTTRFFLNMTYLRAYLYIIRLFTE